jgi:hypothetical protein
MGKIPARSRKIIKRMNEIIFGDHYKLLRLKEILNQEILDRFKNIQSN